MFINHSSSHQEVPKTFPTREHLEGVTLAVSYCSRSPLCYPTGTWLGIYYYATENNSTGENELEYWSILIIVQILQKFFAVFTISTDWWAAQLAPKQRTALHQEWTCTSVKELARKLTKLDIWCFLIRVEA